MPITMSINADKKRRKKNRRNDRPANNQRPPPHALDEIFKTILPRYDEELYNMLKDAHRPLDRDRLESVARERITKLRAVYSTKLQEVHEKWKDLALVIRRSEISVTELVYEHENYIMASQEAQRMCEEYVKLQNMLPPLIEKMVAVRADEVQLIKETMWLMENANSCPNKIEINNFDAQIIEIVMLRKQRLGLKERVENLNKRIMDNELWMVEFIETMKNADEGLECGEGDMLVCRDVIELLRKAQQEAESAKQDLDSAVAGLKEINPSAETDLEKL